MNERRYSDRPGPGGRSDGSSRNSYDERRSPGYDQDFKKSPARTDVVNDWRREDRFGNGRRSDDGGSKVEGRSPDRQSNPDMSSPPIVRPVREILGDSVSPIRGLIAEQERMKTTQEAHTEKLDQVAKSQSSLEDDLKLIQGDDKSPGPDGFLAALFKEVAAPLKVNDYWPISCCNVLFKCICKIISNRMKDCLKDLVSLNQSAFVLSRRISDNILLTQELMHNCHLDRGPPRCAFKVDIQKARVRESDMFTYHRQCSKLNIINLCFTDDLFLFANDDTYSAQVIMDALEEFKIASGLTPSKLSVKYLGVPLVPSHLVYRDCTELLERVKKRIYDWKNKSLSIAGRAQLIRGFLWCQGDMQRGKEKVAWESVCLPKSKRGLGSSNAWKMTWGWRKILQVGFNLSAKKDLNDKVVEFSVTVWNSIRPQSNKIRWHNLVWFPQNIPYHGIHVWLCKGLGVVMLFVTNALLAVQADA
nr:probable ADP-ribosylation factor GTPase-activating protein AGD14 isoform X1 [Tanacetum cinerariifolium]